jgi:hypothetical protein
VRETREAALREAQSQWGQRESEYTSQLNQLKAQLQALVGVTPSNQNPEIESIRKQFGSLYPGLSKMEDRAEQLMQVLERANDLETQNSHYWQSYGRQTMDRLFSQATESLGTPLTDEGKRLLHASFVGFVQSSPELQERYVSDPSIVQDFWRQYAAAFIDPIRRTSAAGVMGRAPGALPQDTPGGAPRTTPAPQMANLDDRAAAAWAVYQQHKG